MNSTREFLILLIPLFLTAAVPARAADTVYTIGDAYRAAIRTNEIVKISEENVLQSESRVDQAFTYLYPRVAGQAAYTRYNEVLPPNDGGVIFQPLGQFQASLVLRQPLYTGGRTLAGLRSAQTFREMSVSDLNTTKQDMMLSAGTAFYGVLKAQKTVEKSRGSVERMERHKQVTEREAATRRTKANVSNLLRARTLVSQTRITLTRDENDLLIARRRLNLLTGLPVDSILAEPEPEAGNLPDESLEGLKKIALANRDDYASSKLNQQAAEENVAIVRGGHYPQAYAEGGVVYINSSPATLMDATTYYGGLRIQIPVFEGGLMKAELSEARSKRRQAELATKNLERNIETEIYESLMNCRTVASVLEAARKQYQDAVTNYATVESLFSQGLLSSLALIDAQQALFLAERELVNATYDREIAILRLKRSVGLLGKTEPTGDGHHAAS